MKGKGKRTGITIGERNGLTFWVTGGDIYLTTAINTSEKGVGNPTPHSGPSRHSPESHQLTFSATRDGR
jgi:hypothetical protein